MLPEPGQADAILEELRTALGKTPFHFGNPATDVKILDGDSVGDDAATGAGAGASSEDLGEPPSETLSFEDQLKEIQKKRQIVDGIEDKVERLIKHFKTEVKRLEREEPQKLPRGPRKIPRPPQLQTRRLQDNFRNPNETEEKTEHKKRYLTDQLDTL